MAKILDTRITRCKSCPNFKDPWLSPAYCGKDGRILTERAWDILGYEHTIPPSWCPLPDEKPRAAKKGRIK